MDISRKYLDTNYDWVPITPVTDTEDEVYLIETAMDQINTLSGKGYQIFGEFNPTFALTPPFRFHERICECDITNVCFQILNMKKDKGEFMAHIRWTGPLQDEAKRHYYGDPFWWKFMPRIIAPPSNIAHGKLITFDLIYTPYKRIRNIYYIEDRKTDTTSVNKEDY